MKMSPLMNKIILILVVAGAVFFQCLPLYSGNVTVINNGSDDCHVSISLYHPDKGNIACYVDVIGWQTRSCTWPVDECPNRVITNCLSLYCTHCYSIDDDPWSLPCKDLSVVIGGSNFVQFGK
jgi:hypothetical protein